MTPSHRSLVCWLWNNAFDSNNKIPEGANLPLGFISTDSLQETGFLQARFLVREPLPPQPLLELTASWAPTPAPTGSRVIARAADSKVSRRPDSNLTEDAESECPHG